MATEKVVTVTHQQVMMLKEGDIKQFMLNMVKLGHCYGEPESIKGPYLSEDDDGKLFVIRFKKKKEAEDVEK